MATTLLRRGAQWFRDKVPDAAAETVEVRAGADAIATLEAIPGRRDYLQFTSDEYAGTAESFDWICAEQDLIFNDAKKQPDDGWEIRLVLADERVAVYKVLPATGGKCFTVVDQLGLMYRIHTKLDRIETPQA